MLTDPSATMLVVSLRWLAWVSVGVCVCVVCLSSSSEWGNVQQQPQRHATNDLKCCQAATALGKQASHCQLRMYREASCVPFVNVKALCWDSGCPLVPRPHLACCCNKAPDTVVSCTAAAAAVQVRTSVSALTPWTLPVTPLPPSARALPSALLLWSRWPCLVPTSLAPRSI